MFEAVPPSAWIADCPDLAPAVLDEVSAHRARDRRDRAGRYLLPYARHAATRDQLVRTLAGHRTIRGSSPWSRLAPDTRARVSEAFRLLPADPADPVAARVLDEVSACPELVTLTPSAALVAHMGRSPVPVPEADRWRLVGLRAFAAPLVAATPPNVGPHLDPASVYLRPEVDTVPTVLDGVGLVTVLVYPVAGMGPTMIGPVATPGEWDRPIDAPEAPVTTAPGRVLAFTVDTWHRGTEPRYPGGVLRYTLTYRPE